MKELFLFITASLFAAGQDVKEISIAVIGERSRVALDAPVYLPFLAKAPYLAVEDRQSELEKQGIRIKIQEFHTDGGSTLSYKVMKDVLASDTVAAVGIHSSDDAVQMVPLLQGTDYLVVSPTTTSSALQNIQPNFIEFAASNSELAKQMELFTTFLRSKNIVSVVAWDSANSQDLYHSLSSQFRSRTHLVKIAEELSNLNAVVKEILALGPDTILLPNFPICSATLISALSRSGFKGNFVGPNTWGEGVDPSFMRIVGDAKFSAYSIRQVSRFDLSPEEKNFRSRLMRGSRIPYPSGAAQYYDTTQYLLDLILGASGKVTRKALLDRAQVVGSQKGLTGEGCDRLRKCKGRSFKVIKVDGKGFRLFNSNLSALLKKDEHAAKKN